MTASKLIATVFGLGYLRPAPGTWGSAAAVPLAIVLHGIGGFPLLLAATIAVFLLGFWAVKRELIGSENKDPSEIVIDEVVGQWIALLAPSFAFWWIGLDSWTFPYPAWVTAFIAFRVFDIWKPWLVGLADRRGDALGVILDDIWAGVFAGITVLIAAGISHGFLM